MSKRDLQRIEVFADVQAGRITTDSTAVLLGLSVRQVQRLLMRFRTGGGAAIIHLARGKPSNYQLTSGLQSYVIELIRQNYSDFGPTLAAEALHQRHGHPGIKRDFTQMDDGCWAVGFPQAAARFPSTTLAS